jgi:hypothetical protein
MKGRNMSEELQFIYESDEPDGGSDGTGGSGSGGTGGSGSGGTGGSGSGGTKGSGSGGTGGSGSGGTGGSGSGGTGGSGSGGTKGSGSGGIGGSGSGGTGRSGSGGTGGSGSGGTKGSGSGGTGGSGSGGSGTGGTKGSGSGGTGGSASSSAAYHNGGVEGDSLSDWYDNNLGQEFQENSSNGATVLDLSNAGAVITINESTASDGTQSGSVEFQDADGQPVAWGHYEGIDQVIPSADPDSHYYSIDELNVLGQHGEDQPPEVSLDAFISASGEDIAVSNGIESGAGGTGGSGSGGTKGSGTGGTGGSGSGGTGGSGSGGTGGSGSGGTKGSGTGGTGGSGSGGTGGSGSGGTGASGTASTATAAAAALPTFSYHEDDEQITEDDVMALMNQDVDEQEFQNSEDDDMDTTGEFFI